MRTVYTHARVPQTPDVVSPVWGGDDLDGVALLVAPRAGARDIGHLLSRAGPASLWTVYDHARMPQTPGAVSPVRGR